jgi:hypothetical protein
MRVDVSFNDILWLWLANGKVKRLFLLRNNYIVYIYYESKVQLDLTICEPFSKMLFQLAPVYIKVWSQWNFKIHKEKMDSGTTKNRNLKHNISIKCTFFLWFHLPV